VWDINKMQTLKDYHDYYLTSDVLLLSDVFEHFRRDVLQKHGLDCLCYPTLPSLAWSMALKHTQAELDLISDPEMYLIIENSIRGGSRPFLTATPRPTRLRRFRPLRTNDVHKLHNLPRCQQSLWFCSERTLTSGRFQISHTRRSFRPRSRLYTRRFTHGLYNAV